MTMPKITEHPDQNISDPANLKRWFWQTPNLYDDADLDPYEFRLLSHYCRVGNCWEGTDTTAAKCHMSTGQVSEKRKSLAEKGFIALSTHQYGSLQITIIDKWQENFEHYSSLRSVKPEDSHSEHKKTQVQEPNNNKTEPAKPSPKQQAWNELRDVLVIVSPMDLERFEALWKDYPDFRRHQFALEQTKKFANPVSSRYYETIFLRYDPERPKEEKKGNGRGEHLEPTAPQEYRHEDWIRGQSRKGESLEQAFARLKAEGVVGKDVQIRWRQKGEIYG